MVSKFKTIFKIIFCRVDPQVGDAKPCASQETGAAAAVNFHKHLSVLWRQRRQLEYAIRRTYVMKMRYIAPVIGCMQVVS